MNLKSFIIASIVIHITVGIALYFYYNPIVLDPKPVLVEKTELEEERATKDLVHQREEEKASPAEKNLKEAEIKPKKELKTETILGRKKTMQEEERHLELSEGSFAELENEKDEITRAKEELEQDEKKQNSRELVRDFSFLKQKPGNPPLSYPGFARKLKMQGTVKLLFFVDERGLVDKIQLESSSGHGELDNYVLRVLARYQFLEKQEGWVRYDQDFVLEGEEREYLRLRQEGSEVISEGSVLGSEGKDSISKDQALTKEFEQISLTREETKKKVFEEKEIEKDQDEIEFIDYESLEEAN